MVIGNRYTTSFSSSSFPPPIVTSANSGLKPSTWLASFSMKEYGMNCSKDQATH